MGTNRVAVRLCVAVVASAGCLAASAGLAAASTGALQLDAATSPVPAHLAGTPCRADQQGARIVVDHKEYQCVRDDSGGYSYEQVSSSDD
jgi:hypothetical protein